MSLNDWEQRAKHYLANGFREIQGWSSSGMIYAILASAQRYQISQGIQGSVAEIGVHHGRLFLYLDQLRDCASEHALAIDLFEHQILNIDASGLGDATMFQSNVSRYSQSPETVLTITGDSTSNQVRNRVLSLNTEYRFFSIDGGHTVGHALNDLRLVEKVLANGGLAILDDVFTLEWASVTEGLYHYLFQKGELIPVVATAPKLMLTTLSHAKTLQQHIRAELASQYKLSMIDLAGHDVLLVSKAAAS